MDARTTYSQGKQSRADEVRTLERRSRAFGTARLITVGAMLVLFGAIVWGPLPQNAWWAEAALVALFILLVVRHARVEEEKGWALAAKRFHERGLDRLDGKWTTFASRGDRFRKAGHAFADDLDILGPASLFQRIDATETRFGEERLAAWLAHDELPSFPDGVRARQEAIRDLSPRVAFRERLSALGALLREDKPDPSPFLQWAEGAMPFDHPVWLVWAARALPALALVVAIAVTALDVPRTPLYAVLALEVLVVLWLRPKVHPILAAVVAREEGIARYGDILEAVEREAFESPWLRERQARLRGGEGPNATRGATAEMRAFARIIGFAEARNNGFFALFVGPFLLWDLNCALALERWRRRAGGRARAWLEVVGELEALSSLAGLAFERPDMTWPTLEAEPVFEARALGHPLLPPERRVDNDVSLGGAGHALIVTGSNMSGKSTLLRAIGVNAVLARLGGPVNASALRIGPLRVATSMRVSDSLEQGISHFYAELRKLKQVIDMARERDRETVLFLLDEVLHGTNSRERILGARAILRELVALGATGAISTHDLGISDLEKELDGAVENVHFEEQVDGDRMTFDYRLRRGVVRSSNALRLMKIVGLDVVVEG